MKSFIVNTNKKIEMVNITAHVKKIVKDLGIKDGVVTIYVPHTTAGITINENTDPDVVIDVLTSLDRMVPSSGKYSHAEGNASAHVKASLMGASVQVPVVGGHIQLGSWQAIYFCEFEGPRNRKVWVK